MISLRLKVKLLTYFSYMLLHKKAVGTLSVKANLKRPKADGIA